MAAVQAITAETFELSERVSRVVQSPGDYKGSVTRNVIPFDVDESMLVRRGQGVLYDHFGKDRGIFLWKNHPFGAVTNHQRWHNTESHDRLHSWQQDLSRPGKLSQHGAPIEIVVSELAQVPTHEDSKAISCRRLHVLYCLMIRGALKIELGFFLWTELDVAYRSRRRCFKGDGTASASN